MSEEAPAEAPAVEVPQRRPPTKMIPAAPTTTVEELEKLPLSPELLTYYRDRLRAEENDMRALTARIDATAASQASQHKARWETLKRMDEITDLQKALSDAHCYLWEEREKGQRLQAENDELKVQELEDRRKIQHLLSLVDPLVQDTTYVRDAPPETMTLHPHARSTTSGRPRGSAAAAGPSEGVVVAPAGSDGAVRLTSDGTRVLRTVYLPNEQVYCLLLTVEALRTQLQQAEQLGRERVAALLEDRRLRIAEERARRAAESERAQEADANLERTEKMLTQYTRDFLSLKHEALSERRKIVECLEGALYENSALKQEMDQTRMEAQAEIHAVNTTSKSSAEQYINLYRQQVSDTERTMSLLKDQHNGLQQALAMRVKELEAIVARLKGQYKALEERRGLEVEGFTQEISLMRKKVQRLELKAYGRRLPLSADGGYAPVPGENEGENAQAVKPRGATAKVTAGARALRAMQQRVVALEKNLLAAETLGL